MIIIILFIIYNLSSVVYKCTVSASAFPNEVYIGLTEKEFKSRWSNHKQSLNNEKYKYSTSLSTHVWDLKEKGATPTLKWSILRHAKSYTANARSCSLCLQEKFEILFYYSKNELLNKRSELIAKYRHMNKLAGQAGIANAGYVQLGHLVIDSQKNRFHHDSNSGLQTKSLES